MLHPDTDNRKRSIGGSVMAIASLIRFKPTASVISLILMLLKILSTWI